LFCFVFYTFSIDGHRRTGGDGALLIRNIVKINFTGVMPY